MSENLDIDKGKCGARKQIEKLNPVLIADIFSICIPFCTVGKKTPKKEGSTENYCRTDMFYDAYKSKVSVSHRYTVHTVFIWLFKTKLYIVSYYQKINIIYSYFSFALNIKT